MVNMAQKISNWQIIQSGYRITGNTPFDFLNGRGNHRYEMLSEYFEFDKQKLEHIHNYIQWVFPLKTMSPVDRTAPILREVDKITYPEAYERASQAVKEFFIKKMLPFYGFWHWNGYVIPKPKTIFGMQPWMQEVDDHNYKRITRITLSLKYFGHKDLANKFIKQIVQIHNTHSIATHETLLYWLGAWRTE